MRADQVDACAGGSGKKGFKDGGKTAEEICIKHTCGPICISLETKFSFVYFTISRYRLSTLKNHNGLLGPAYVCVCERKLT